MKIKKIEIDFPCKVELPEGFDRVLSSLIQMVCERYKIQNPTRTMWPVAYGCKPIYIPLTAEEEKTHGMKFDEAIYHIEVAERADIHCQNRNNPDRDKILATRRARRSEAAKQKDVASSQWKNDN